MELTTCIREGVEGIQVDSASDFLDNAMGRTVSGVCFLLFAGC